MYYVCFIYICIFSRTGLRLTRRYFVNGHPITRAAYANKRIFNALIPSLLAVMGAVSTD